MNNNKPPSVRKRKMNDMIDELEEALEDFDVLLRLALKYQFLYINKKLASYRVHSNQNSINFQIMLENCSLFNPPSKSIPPKSYLFR